MDYHRTAIAGVCTIICFLIASITALVALGRDPAQVIYLMGAIAAPTITGLLTLGSTERVNTKVKKVEQNTNGNLTTVLNHNEQLIRLLTEKGIELPKRPGFGAAESPENYPEVT